MRTRDRARRVKMILSDVDGTLTDGTIAVFPEGEEVKSYDVKDGLGVMLAHVVGLEVAHLGDDLGDLAVMKRAGLAASVRDAHHLIRKQAHYVCALGGGRGAFRELVEFIIGAQKKWGVVEDRFNSMSDRKL